MIGEFDYEYRHTLSDTPDKVMSATLQRVGDVEGVAGSAARVQAAPRLWQRVRRRQL